MSNYKPDLKGIITRQTLAAGDTCYLLMTEGNDKILELFDCKYYPPSPEEFVQHENRYDLAI